ncbi:hypothetical protein LzC2_26300 [Planctomycetes bacterium LzC2]|uniref:Uncharacterized protein n=1 Tax=Alienimonas chondri TaxID=2681879 RepID=A0ABX1VGH0_9PLAN|nr:hypothetical protein [Alienimonas chondri]
MERSKPPAAPAPPSTIACPAVELLRKTVSPKATTAPPTAVESNRTSAAVIVTSFPRPPAVTAPVPKTFSVPRPSGPLSGAAAERSAASVKSAFRTISPSVVEIVLFSTRMPSTPPGSVTSPRTVTMPVPAFWIVEPTTWTPTLSAPAAAKPVTLTAPAAASVIVPPLSRYTPWLALLPAKPLEPPVPATVTPPPFEVTAEPAPLIQTPRLASSPSPPVPVTLTAPAAAPTPVSAIVPPPDT